jgi:peroxiredoxin
MRLWAARLLIISLLALPSLANSEDDLSPPPERHATPAPFHVGNCDELAADSRLTDAWGKQVALKDLWTSDHLVILVMGTECPLARLYASRFQELAKQHHDKACDFVMVDANTQDSLADLQRFIDANHVEITLLKDLGQRLTRKLAAVRTPESFLLNREGQVIYRGRIDDQYQIGVTRPEIGRKDLQVAIHEALSGSKIEVPNTPVQGCLIGKRPSRDTRQAPLEPIVETTFAEHIAPFLNRHCIRCHREGDIGPMSFSDYDEVVGWSETILEVVQDRRMPPWHAVNPAGTFKNEQRVTPEEIATLETWVRLGAPPGNLEKVPEPPKFASQWRLETPPDQIVAMAPKPFDVPGQGTIEYQYYVVDPGWKEDRWVRATQVLPGNPSVVHHAIVFLRTPDVSRFDGLGWLGGYVPGQMPTVLDPHQARRIPAGSKLVFQMHYTPTGRPEEDQTQIGIWFADEAEVEEEVVTGIVLNHSFEIPPHANHFPVKASLQGFPHGSHLLSLTPHMHVRGKAIQVWTSDTASSDNRPANPAALTIDHYDFNWQHNYELKDPIPLTPDSLIGFEAVFDNSKSNPVNPNPDVAVRWGDQTWEEMAVVFVNVSIPRDAETVWSRSETLDSSIEALENAKACLARFDRNGDGFIQRREAPETFAAFAFGKFDENNDNRLSLDELMRR